MYPIDKSSSIPYYLQLAELLRREIADRPSLQEIYQLPSENELADLHGITRATVRRALDVLERDGWIYKEKGRGSFAAVRRVEYDLTQLVSTTEDMRERGWSLKTRVISLHTVTASNKIAQALEQADGAACHQLFRLRLVDDEPISLQTSYLPVELCPSLEENDLTQSLYRLLETRYGHRLWTGEGLFRAQCVSRGQRDLLQVPEGTPVMYHERVTYTTAGLAIEYLEAVWLGDRYDFTVTLSRPQT